MHQAVQHSGGLCNLRVALLVAEIWAEPLGDVAKSRCEFSPLCDFFFFVKLLPSFAEEEAHILPLFVFALGTSAADARRALRAAVLRPLPDREDRLVLRCMHSSVKLQLIALSPSVRIATSGTGGNAAVA